METSKEDRALLGLPEETSDNELEREVEKKTKTNYNPFNPADNEEILWISPRATRLKAWISEWPVSMNEAVENFVNECDVLQSVDSHAFICLRAMKLRDLVTGKEIKDLIFKLALGHLKIITHCHSDPESNTSKKVPKHGHLW